MLYKTNTPKDVTDKPNPSNPGKEIASAAKTDDLPWYHQDMPQLPTSLQLLKAPSIFPEMKAAQEKNQTLSSENVSLRSLGKLASQSFNFYWERQRDAVLKLGGLAIASAATTIGMVYLNANLSAAVSRFITADTSKISDSAIGASLTLPLAAFTLIVLTNAVERGCALFRQGTALRVNQKTKQLARDELTSHTELLSIEKASSQKNADQSQLVLLSISEKSRIPEAASGALSGIVQVGISSIFIAQTFPVLASALVVSAIPNLISSLNRSLERCCHNLDYAILNRLGALREWTLSHPKALIPFRRLGEISGLRALRDEVIEPINRSLQRLDNRDIGGAVIASTIQLATIGVAGYSVLSTDLATGTSLAGTLGHLGLVVSFAGGLSSLMKGVSELAKSLLIVKPLYDLVDENRELRRTEEHKLTCPKLEAAPRIQVNEVTYRSDGRIILDNISLDIAPGEILGICGPSGHGKSTLIKIIQGSFTPHSGSVVVTINGTPYNIDQVHIDSWTHQIGSLGQGDWIMDGFQISHNLRFGNRTLPKGQEAVKGVIDIPHLLGHMKATVQSMVGDGWFGGIRPSGGENQQLSLGRALATDKKVVILDEPLTGIHVEQAKAIQDSIISVARSRGDTLIFVTHGLADLRKADRILVIENGRIVDQGTPQELSERPGFYRDGSMQSLKATLEIFGNNPEITENEFETVIRIRKHRPV